MRTWLFSYYLSILQLRDFDYRTFSCKWLFLQTSKNYKEKGVNSETIFCYIIKSNSRYLSCLKAANLQCRGRANFIIGEKPTKFVVTQSHNHPKDIVEKRILDFVKQLKLTCQRGTDLSTKQIYYDLATA